MIEIKHRDTGLVLHSVKADTPRGADLRHKKLARADLRGADLQQARLYRADLSGADLEGVRLNGARVPIQHLAGSTVLNWLVVATTVGASLFPTLIAILIAQEAEGPWALLALPFVAATVFALLVGMKVTPFGVDKRGTDLNLREANLRGADLSDADLRGTDLSGADLESATLDRTNLRAAILRGANLRAVRMRHAELRTQTSGADYALPVDLRETNLQGADLSGTRMGRAILRGANLAGACLARIDGEGADFRSANLTGANLRGAKLVDADFRYANLIGADFRDDGETRVRLSRARWDGARYDETTLWPPSFHPSQHGAVAPFEVVPAPVPSGRGDEVTPG